MSQNEVYFLWLLVGAVGFMIGANKGRGFIGFILGMALGPLGWLLIIIFHDHRRNCPECRKSVDSEARICPFCRSELPVIIAQSTTAALPTLAGAAPKERGKASLMAGACVVLALAALFSFIRYRQTAESEASLRARLAELTSEIATRDADAELRKTESEKNLLLYIKANEAARQWKQLAEDRAPKN